MEGKTMLFRTQLHYELKMPLPAALYGEDPGIQHWRAFEIVMHNFWFIVEFLVEEGEGEQFWKTICAHTRDAVIELISSDVVLEHRINLVIPTYHNEERQLQMKPVVAIHEADEDGQRSMTIYVTSDNSRYVDSALGMKESQAENKTILYAKKDIDVRRAVPDEES